MLKTDRKILIALIALHFYLPAAHAVENSQNTLLNYYFVSSLSIGSGWQRAGQTQTVDLTPDVTKTYTANKPTNTLPTGELFLGIGTLFSTQAEGQIGLAFLAAQRANLSGNIWDDGDPNFNNYTYQYKVAHTAINLKAKLLGHWNLPIIPWISTSLGVAFNKAYAFSNTPTTFETIQSPDFSSHTTKAFTYAIGIGVERQLTSSWQIGAGYEFSDWGKSALGPVPGGGSNRGLSLSHLYTNSILFNLTYIA
ncbi:MAG: porin family protein [Gammaproteobacteria bacterium]|nr:porin family protein [Gammaproteobacteria bacterium]